MLFVIPTVLPQQTTSIICSTSK